MRTAVIQSNYLPWKGYFDLLAGAEHVIFYDDVQYTKNDWRNRNQILGKDGPRWITVPVGSSISRTIDQVRFPPDKSWLSTHKSHFRAIYESTPMYERSCQVFDFMQNLETTSLSELNQLTTIWILNNMFEIFPKFSNSRDFNPEGTGSDRLIDLLKKVQATEYISGPSGRNYLIPESFQESNIRLEYLNYNYKLEYKQPVEGFWGNLSIVDALACFEGEPIEFLELERKGRIA